MLKKETLSNVYHTVTENYAQQVMFLFLAAVPLFNISHFIGIFFICASVINFNWSFIKDRTKNYQFKANSKSKTIIYLYYWVVIIRFFLFLIFVQTDTDIRNFVNYQNDTEINEYPSTKVIVKHNTDIVQHHDESELYISKFFTRLK